MATALNASAPVTLPADQFQTARLRPGTPGGPLVLMTPAWDDVFGYQALAESFPTEVEVVALTYEEPAEGHIVTTVDELVAAFRPAADEIVSGRDRVLVLGWSVGGVVAAELADQLAAEGVAELEVVLVDTFFPGQHRHLWSNRWWKYKSMLRPGTFGAALREFMRMGGRRVQGYVGRFGRLMFVWSGGEVAATVERTSVGGFPVEALDHDIPAVRAPMLYFAATTTNPERTIRRWSQVASDIDIVSIPGRHRGLDSVMDADRVHRISGEVMARLERHR
jgi:thioesterase domain-containing protein